MKPPCSISQKCRPVSTLAREGAHDGAVVKPLVNNTPSFATRSKAGVGSFDQPYALRSTALSSSVMKNRMFGGVEPLSPAAPQSRAAAT